MLKNLKQFSLPEVEEKVLKYWKDKSVFAQSLKKNRNNKKGTYVFYEGPPTANGHPGIHHVLARAFKDVMPRYKTMRGFSVPRKAGWDTHGLPVEIQAEKELGLNSKTEIEKYGVGPFNKYCKELVWRYLSEWEELTERMGFWVDMDNPYITYDSSYMETLWWIVSQADKRKLLYLGHKVVPWCTRCGTPLSSHELAQGYKEVEDTSVFVKFKLKKDQKFGELKTDNKTFVLSWTTTPWTLPGNVALAVGKDIKYSFIKVRDSGELYILAKDLVAGVMKDVEIEAVGEVLGKNLVGLSYEPLFDVAMLKSPPAGGKSYKIYPADFVTTTDGTGVVHTAVMYGEDDYQLGLKLGLVQKHTVDEAGKFEKAVKGFGGLSVKSQKTEEMIFEHLKKNNTLLRTERYTHDYPFCWRCDNRLIYYARESWFFAMSKLRKELLAANDKINWTPKHIKEGRFGEWLREVKDWSISRNRYWGTPIPVWLCEGPKCSNKLIVGSVDDLAKNTKSMNKYFGVRHGEATSNLDKKLASGPETGNNIARLTEKGEREAERVARSLKGKKIDLIFASPYTRTKQTAKIIAKETGAPVKFDKRLEEVDVGIMRWHDVSAWYDFGSSLDRFTKAPEKAETYNDVRSRMISFIREIEAKHQGKNIVIVSHGDPLWILNGAVRGLSDEEIIDQPYPKTGSVINISAPLLSYDDEGKLDLHRPFIDDVTLYCKKCKKNSMKRIPDVIDVWFDSGAMPFAQNHFPFEQTMNLNEKGIASAYKKIPFPADYISEAIDQTRGWFYTLLAISVLLKKPAPYKNVICLGHINDKNGIKMSKSKGNIVNPWEMMNNHGADAVRWHFYTMNDPGDFKNFDEADLAKVVRKVVLILYNSYVFWASYGKKKEVKKNFKPENVLDRWILAKMEAVSDKVTKKMEKYEVGTAGRVIEAFVDDLSRWYIRRSRDRFQEVARKGVTSEGDWESASYTLQLVLSTITKLLAPFMPFFAEALYQSVDGSLASVHLEDWPKLDVSFRNKELISEMEIIREVAALALALRAEAGIKVRQPLASVTLKNDALSGREELLAVLRDEVNVKKVLFDKKQEKDVALDLNISKELAEEGVIRELARMIQSLRASANYNMVDEVTLMISAPDALSNLIQRHGVVLKKMVNAKELMMKKGVKFDAGKETKLDNWRLWLGVKKI